MIHFTEPDFKKQRGYDQLQAIYRASVLNETKDLFEYIQDTLDRIRREGDTYVNEPALWNQGARQALQELLDMREIAKQRLQSR